MKKLICQFYNTHIDSKIMTGKSHMSADLMLFETVNEPSASEEGG